MTAEKPTGAWLALETLRHQPVVANIRRHAGIRAQRVARWRLARRTVLAASGIAAIAVFLTMSSGSTGVIETDINEMRHLRLADGSGVILDASSRLKIDFTPESRTVFLLAGQAHFDVTKDHMRPFRVRAGGSEVVAVGTSFDINTLHQNTIITLIEGRVDVHALANTAIEPLIETLWPGQQLSVGQNGKVSNVKSDMGESATAWQREIIDLDDLALEDALMQINRHSSVTIRANDPDIKALRISGVFRAGNTQAIIASLERRFNLKARKTSKQTVILEHP